MKAKDELTMIKSEVIQFLFALDRGYFPGALEAMTINGEESEFLQALRKSVEE